MTPAEYTAAVRRHYPSYKAFAAAWGISTTTASRYAKGHRSVPGCIAKGLKTMDELEHALLQIEELRREIYSIGRMTFSDFTERGMGK